MSQSPYYTVPTSESTTVLTAETNTAVPSEEQPINSDPQPQRRTTTFNIDDSNSPADTPSRRTRKRTSQQTNASNRLSKLSLSRMSLHVKETLEEHLQPTKPVAPAPSFLHGVKAIVCMSWFNILLVFIPVSWALHFIFADNTTPSQDTLIFVFSFLAIMPLAKLLAFATDELSIRVGQTLAGLLNATLGNAVELIVAIIALVKCELQVVQSSLVGSILSNLLLVLGMCFFAGGMRFSEQGFGISSTQLNSSLLTVSVIAVLLPAAFHFTAGAEIPDPEESREILAVSHGAAIILLFIYLCYLIFQLFSHKGLYDDKNEEIMKSKKYAPRKNYHIGQRIKKNLHIRSRNDLNAAENGAVLNGGADTFVNAAPLTGSPRTSLDSHPTTIPGSEGHTDLISDNRSDSNTEGAEEEEVEEPSMSVYMTIGLLAVVTVLVAVTAEFLVSSIDGLTSTGAISKEFVGLILLPIVGNAAEHVTAVTVSMKDKITLSLGVAVGSSIQIALFVIPFIVTLAWWIGKPLTLLFDPFESIVLFLSVIVVNYTVADGRSNWLEGMILMCLYTMLAVVFWYYPGVNITLSATCN